MVIVWKSALNCKIDVDFKEKYSNYYFSNHENSTKILFLSLYRSKQFFFFIFLFVLSLSVCFHARHELSLCIDVNLRRSLERILSNCFRATRNAQMKNRNNMRVILNENRMGERTNETSNNMNARTIEMIRMLYCNTFKCVKCHAWKIQIYFHICFTEFYVTVFPSLRFSYENVRILRFIIFCDDEKSGK